MGKQHREQLSCDNTLSRDRFIECKRNRDGLDIIVSQRRQEWSRGHKRVWTLETLTWATDFKSKKKQSRQRRKRRKKRQRSEETRTTKKLQETETQESEESHNLKTVQKSMKKLGKVGDEKERTCEHIESIIKRSEKRRNKLRLKLCQAQV